MRQTRKRRSAREPQRALSALFFQNRAACAGSQGPAQKGRRKKCAPQPPRLPLGLGMDSRSPWAVQLPLQSAPHRLRHPPQGLHKQRAAFTRPTATAAILPLPLVALAPREGRRPRPRLGFHHVQRRGHQRAARAAAVQCHLRPACPSCDRTERTAGERACIDAPGTAQMQTPEKSANERALQKELAIQPRSSLSTCPQAAHAAAFKRRLMPSSPRRRRCLPAAAATRQPRCRSRRTFAWPARAETACTARGPRPGCTPCRETSGAGA